MDVRYINPFIESVRHLFKTMLQADLMISKPMLVDGDMRADASAVIGFSGDVVGSVVLCFPLPTAVKAASAFAGMEINQDHEDFADALGELANIVAGQAKSKLDGFNVSISLPNVIIGREHAVLQSKQRPRLAIPCDSMLGRFTVEVAMVIDDKRDADRPMSQTAAAGAQ